MTHAPRKRFGQNFLHDPGVIRRIVQVIAPRPGDRMVEIGPGLGALTRELLPILGELDVVELDRDVIPRLEQACRKQGTLRIHQADALRFDFSQFGSPQSKMRVVGNLPYNIATPLLFHLFQHLNGILNMHFMLQKEVVQRMVAPPNSEHYGRLSVMVQFHCAATQLFTVGRGAFQPAPKVESAFVRLVPHATPPVQVVDADRFSRVVAQAFSHRRKTLRNALAGVLSEADILAAGIPLTARAEQLTLGEFAKLSNI